jgi:predicted 2-oxoglutarate/Fe(II)-dependent dioxygenase YbiX
MLDSFYNKGFFNPKQVKRLNKFIESKYSHIEKAANTARNEDGTSKKKSKTLIIYRRHLKEIIPMLETYVHYVNDNYFGYDLYPFNDHDVCLYNIYESSNQGGYDYHVDTSRSDVYDFKLTILVNLSNQSFEGGKFYIFNGGEYEAEEVKQPGTVLMFKSYLNHKVSTVIAGQRKTLTFFARGPRLK